MLRIHSFLLLGCNFMAHASPTAPWSFTPITITSKNNILVGLHLFHCKTSGCKVARKCNINRVSYENGGWRDFPSSSDSKIDILNDLLKVFKFAYYVLLYLFSEFYVTMQNDAACNQIHYAAKSFFSVHGLDQLRYT